jgi:hypothetical protein
MEKKDLLEEQIAIIKVRAEDEERLRRRPGEVPSGDR